MNFTVSVKDRRTTRPLLGTQVVRDAKSVSLPTPVYSHYDRVSGVRGYRTSFFGLDGRRTVDREEDRGNTERSRT